MCHTGQCKYEGYYGDCRLHGKDIIPEDADCVIRDKEMEKYYNKLSSRIKRFWNKIKDLANTELDTFFIKKATKDDMDDFFGV